MVRLLRAGRLLISIPEVYVLMSGLASALKPIIYGSIMLISVIMIWAIIVVEFLHPVNVQTLGPFGCFAQKNVLLLLTRQSASF